MKDREILGRFAGVGLTAQGAVQRTLGPGEKRTRVLRVAALCLWMACICFTAPLCYGQECPLHLPANCQLVANEVNALQAERKDLQAELNQSVGSQKQGKAGPIMKLLSQINAKQKEVNICLAKSGKQDSGALLTGSIGLGFLKYFPQNSKQGWQYGDPQYFSMTLTYLRWMQDQVVVNIIGSGEVSSSVPDFTPESDLAKKAAGHFSSGCGDVDAATGKLSVTLTIPVSLSGPLANEGAQPYPLGFSNLAITLSTENPGGSRFDGKGNIRLTGEGIFQDGLLKGRRCQISLNGILHPLP